MKKKLLLLLVAIPFFFTNCNKGEGLNLFSIQDDLELGRQTKAQIEANPAEFPILNPSTNAAAYNYLNTMRNEILDGGQITHRADFAWEIYIIDRDDVVNAFCTPGGYIYVYTGLIKYLDTKSSLAGVLGHEMAHADKRHSSEQLTKKYGIQTMLDLVLGKNQGLLTQVASELVGLKFSRGDESEADEYSVIYLCPTKYHANGAANFFQKILDSGSGGTPEFLSTHPSPDNRVANINNHATENGCTHTIDNSEDVSGYNSFKALF